MSELTSANTYVMDWFRPVTQHLFGEYVGDPIITAGWIRHYLGGPMNIETYDEQLHLRTELKRQGWS